MGDLAVESLVNEYLYAAGAVYVDQLSYGAQSDLVDDVIEQIESDGWYTPAEANSVNDLRYDVDYYDLQERIDDAKWDWNEGYDPILFPKMLEYFYFGDASSLSDRGFSLAQAHKQSPSGLPGGTAIG